VNGQLPGRDLNPLDIQLLLRTDTISIFRVEYGVPGTRIVSFKGSLQALRSWEPHLNQAKISKAERFRLINDLYDAMTNTPIMQRPERSEPRCVKRRPKNYQRMTAPRHEMKVIPHRSKYYAANS
jgi:hypothetical protein